MLDFNNFSWGNLPIDQIEYFKNEIESVSMYNKVFDVEENDIVVDLGAFVGSFTYGILHKNPEHVWVMEPVTEHFKTLYKNLKHYQVSFTKSAISNKKTIEIEWCGAKSITKGITFKDFIETNCIEKIDFFKCDCEGAEYIIFTEENLNFLKNNIKKIVSEFHLINNIQKENFRYFRDNILIKYFDNYHIYSVDGVNIKWDLFNEHFIQYYSQIIIHIDNR